MIQAETYSSHKEQPHLHTYHQHTYDHGNASRTHNAHALHNRLHLHRYTKKSVVKREMSNRSLNELLEDL